MKLNVKHKYWSSTCGDGCCYQNGVETTIECEGRVYEYSGYDDQDNLLTFFKDVLKYDIEEEHIDE